MGKGHNLRQAAWAFALVFSMRGLTLAQPPADSAKAGGLSAVQSFAVEQPGQLAIHRDITATRPFTVTGTRGALLGQQNGGFEAWIFPWKILSGLRISAEMKDYAEPIDVNEQAATIDVQPGHTTITFSHANFTVREILFAPQDAPRRRRGAGLFPNTSSTPHDPYLQLYAGDAAHVAGTLRRSSFARVGAKRGLGLLYSSSQRS